MDKAKWGRIVQLEERMQKSQQRARFLTQAIPALTKRQAEDMVSGRSVTEEEVEDAIERAMSKLSECKPNNEAPQGEP
jgi:hypothetical protein